MFVLPKLAFLILVFWTAAVLPSSAADNRSVLDNCKSVLAQAEQDKAAVGAANNESEIARCRIVIREWTLRDSRMLVDEQGRPQR